MKNLENKKKTAELVGLWLAEGDRKTKLEITITNNCFDLISLSYSVLRELFGDRNYRLYVYRSSPECNIERLDGVRTRLYIDKRARKPYYILRVAGVELVKQWKMIVEDTCNRKEFYADILRGFFAGEGNIHTGSHRNRTIRIAQKRPSDFIDGILNHFIIEYGFSERGRAYIIHGRKNWEKLAKIRIADLHNIKRNRFYEVYTGYKRWQYPKLYIKKNIEKYLDTPITIEELSNKFLRTRTRISEVLGELKVENKIKKFRVGRTTYWLKTEAFHSYIKSLFIIFGKIKRKNLRKTNEKITRKPKRKISKTPDKYKQIHYPKYYIRDRIVEKLEEPKTSLQLAKEFKRSRARIQDVLSEHKKRGKIKNFRVGSIDYWLVAESRIIPISYRKKTILDQLNKFQRVHKIAKKLKIDEKSVFRRLKELEKLELVYRGDSGSWHRDIKDNVIRVL